MTPTTTETLTDETPTDAAAITDTAPSPNPEELGTELLRLVVTHACPGAGLVEWTPDAWTDPHRGDLDGSKIYFRRLEANVDDDGKITVRVELVGHVEPRAVDARHRDSLMGEFRHVHDSGSERSTPVGATGPTLTGDGFVLYTWRSVMGCGGHRLRHKYQFSGRIGAEPQESDEEARERAERVAAAEQRRRARGVVLVGDVPPPNTLPAGRVTTGFRQVTG